jgi:hypothetical protein
MDADQSLPQKPCDACGTEQAPLMKLSLGKDFFGRPYDRLSPSSDASPKWYCDACSMHKNLQRDFRDIQAEVRKWSDGGHSEMDNSEQVERARLRLREIGLLLDKAGGNSPFLRPSDVNTLIHDIEARLSLSYSQPSSAKP